MTTQESSDRLGYCDQHPESTLLPFATLLAGQYGGDQADGNPFRFWRCSRPECERCYDPDVFGYFFLDRNPGGRIQPSSVAGEKCHDCDDSPYLVLGKFGKDRRLRCINHGCANVGPIAFEDVADVAFEATLTPASTLTNDEEKEASELAVFRDFAKATGLAVLTSTNAKPPEPDIRCNIDGGVYWFELGRITDPKLARAINRPKDLKAFSFDQKEPFVSIIQKKTKARYDVQGGPVDLVLYFEQQPPDRAALTRHVMEHAAELSALRETGPFTRVWIYDTWSRSLLWHLP